MSSSGSSLKDQLSQRTDVLGLKLWVIIGIGVGILILCVLCILALCLAVRNRKRLKRPSNNLPVTQIPTLSKEIKEVKVEHVSANEFLPHDGVLLTLHDKSNGKDSDKVIVHLGMDKSRHGGDSSRSGSFRHVDRDAGSQSGEEGNSETVTTYKPSSSYAITAPSPLTGLPEFSHLGWGHWFTLRDLEIATNRFSKDNVIGEGGYGVVYRGCLVNGTSVAIKRLLNNLGQAEKEFRVEVEAIGHVRHKNLVRLLGYCVEGTQRMLVYEYVNNGNLEQWLHGAMRQLGSLTWEARIKILLGTAKALAYLHEAIEPKVVHRDIKSSNILIDDDFNAKVSDFGLAKLLGAGKSHITTRVMGTFGYVAPEYANTGLLNEKSDIYSFGVVLLEAITGRDPVDYGRPANEVNLVEWLKVMVGNRRAEEVVDSNIDAKPSTRALKRALLAALRCVDPDSEKRPKMSQVVRMLESDEPMPREAIISFSQIFLFLHLNQYL
ncbi:putative receptor-like protein kinase [Apostasia shenzhenica]|uniref:non-specific serine/threonine protein kinase n=1 Tax=Apostasia shenzhenica TaxID=1088818 RepID=A0A2I0A021_9ASPA|nr:putative receptor-like protein kinase [Apostasia shenzhenica]